jgi:hypothetical protein
MTIRFIYSGPLLLPQITFVRDFVKLGHPCKGGSLNSVCFKKTLHNGGTLLSED